MIDTAHFKGNFPDTCSIEGTFVYSDEELEHAVWTTLLSRTRLQVPALLLLPCPPLSSFFIHCCNYFSFCRHSLVHLLYCLYVTATLLMIKIFSYLFFPLHRHTRNTTSPSLPHSKSITFASTSSQMGVSAVFVCSGRGSTPRSPTLCPSYARRT